MQLQYYTPAIRLSQRPVACEMGALASLVYKVTKFIILIYKRQIRLINEILNYLRTSQFKVENVTINSINVMMYVHFRITCILKEKHIILQSLGYQTPGTVN